jgi:hypothetical protein
VLLAEESVRKDIQTAEVLSGMAEIARAIEAEDNGAKVNQDALALLSLFKIERPDLSFSDLAGRFVEARNALDQKGSSFSQLTVALNVQGSLRQGISTRQAVENFWKLREAFQKRPGSDLTSEEIARFAHLGGHFVLTPEQLAEIAGVGRTAQTRSSLDPIQLRAMIAIALHTKYGDAEAVRKAAAGASGPLLTEHDFQTVRRVPNMRWMTSQDLLNDAPLPRPSRSRYSRRRMKKSRSEPSLYSDGSIEWGSFGPIHITSGGIKLEMGGGAFLDDDGGTSFGF